MSQFPESLKRLRRENNLTQQKAADLIGVPRGRYGTWEEGRAEPPLDMVVKIAAAFHITTDDLICGKIRPTHRINESRRVFFALKEALKILQAVE